MKRTSDSQLIKIPDSSTVAAATQGLNQPTISHIQATSIFPARSQVLEVPSVGSTPGSGVGVHPLPLTMSRPSVTIHRQDHPSAVPQPAHSGVAVTTAPLGSSQQPVVTQPLGSIKTEAISLPNTPVTIQYATTFPSVGPVSVSSGPTCSVKTIVSSGPLVTPVQNLVHNLPANQPQGPTVQVVQTKPLNHINPPATPLRPISNASLPPTPTATPGDSFQRLKVEDALSYLDQVKFKFGNQPEVYNAFLDIMKEFKSQSIDTPGVIARVSSLFRGHPELIVGFNTFLPHGYKIEVTSNENAMNLVGAAGGKTVQTIVHTPHGITKMTTHGAGPMTTVTTPLQQHIPLPSQPQPQVIRLPLSQTVGTVPKLPAGQQQMVKIESGNAAGFNIAGSMPHVAAPNAAQPVVRPQQPGLPAQQPVEFNHAINYVNKIKNRFQGQPEIYKQFLEILHTYQKDQKAIKEGQRPSGPYLNEAEVYAQVAKLFKNQEDLLSEFSQFLPEATGENVTNRGPNHAIPIPNKKPSTPVAGAKFASSNSAVNPVSSGTFGGIKRPPGSSTPQPAPKKFKSGVLHDVTLAEAGKYGTLNEFAFFDKVRKALRSQEAYDNFLRCLLLFNQEIVTRPELIQLTTPFLSRHTELFKWFKDFVGCQEGHSYTPQGIKTEADLSRSISTPLRPDEIRDPRETERARERIKGDSAMDIDLATCKRLGASYCAVPDSFVQPVCSGRTLLCREVLNDTWVSFPSWSEDSQFVASRKTQFEEAIYRTEDERFEFDMVLETNKDTIKVFECVQKKMARMPPEEAARYKLDDCLGGHSATIHKRAIRRVYGDKAGDIIDGLKRNPVVAVPIVLRRLRAKDEEWREVQKNFNKSWREQNEKYYLKSLDHQSLLFKQSDPRMIRSKSLLNELETAFDDRHEENEGSDHGRSKNSSAQEGPHLSFKYPDFSILDDANNLLIHHVKRQTSIQKEEKHKIKVLLRHFLMDRFKHERQEMSADERDDDLEDELDVDATGKKSDRAKKKDDDSSKKTDSTNEKASEIKKDDIKLESKDGRKTPLHVRNMDTDETYTIFMANNHWYLFFRLHQILCERLTKIYNKALIIANEESKNNGEKKESVAVALRLKPKSEIEPEDYYPAFLDMVKNLLDGNMDGQTFEDTLREMFGIHAYISFTLDKVIGNAVRQLHHLVSEESSVECHDLFVAESKLNGTGGYCGTAVERQLEENVYQKKAEKILAEENCMKIILYHQLGLMTVELLDTETEAQLSDKENASKKIAYINRFIGPDDEISEQCRNHLVTKPIFLPRSVRSFNRSSLAKRALKRNSNDESLSLKQEEDSSDLPYDAGNQCQFNLHSSKVLLILNSNCFYRKLSLKKSQESHKAVTSRKCNFFSRWHASWVRSNVPESDHLLMERWFMGKTEGLVPNRTTKNVKNFLEKTPYRVYHKYAVQYNRETQV